MRTASQTMLIPVIQFFYTTVQYLLLPPSGLWIQIGSVFRNCTDPHRKKVGKIRSKRSEIEEKNLHSETQLTKSFFRCHYFLTV